MIDFELSTKNWVCGEEISSLSCGGSGTRSMDSKRFFGLTAAPRPRTGGSEVIRYPRKRRGGGGGGGAEQRGFAPPAAAPHLPPARVGGWASFFTLHFFLAYL